MNAPRIGEGISLRMCRNCGMNHPKTADCISVLRDRIAVLEFRIGAHTEELLSRGHAGRKAARLNTVDVRARLLL